MIGLTRSTGEHCRLDPDAIERVETSPVTVVFLADGTRYAVAEDVDEVVARIREQRAAVIAACYVLDRGEHHDPQGLGDLPAETHAPTPAVPLRLPRPRGRGART